MAVAEKLRKMVEGWQFPGVPRTVTSALEPQLSPTRHHPRRARKAADSALYAAKQADAIKSSWPQRFAGKRQAPRRTQARIGGAHWPNTIVIPSEARDLGVCWRDSIAAE